MALGKLTQDHCRYRILHSTEYSYAHSVNSARHRAHLVPINRSHQQVMSFVMDVNQPLNESSEGVDFFGNSYRDFSIHTPHRLLNVSVDMTVAVHTPEWPISSPVWSGESFVRRDFDPDDRTGIDFALNCSPYLVDSPMIPLLPNAAAWALSHINASGAPIHEQLLALTRAVYDEFVFDTEATSVGTPLLEVFHHKRGVCQDFSQVMIAALRSLGVPARYVSGYILTHPPEGQPKLIGADATHAWVEAWCPGHGWLGIDPTNGKAVTNEYVILATGRDYTDVIPLRGVVVGGGEHTLEVSVTMTREDTDRNDGQLFAKKLSNDA